MSPKGGAKSSTATSLDELLRDFADAFQASQDKLAAAFDDLASGYQRHDTKLPKIRRRVPFAQWVTSKVNPSILIRVLEARFGPHWSSLPKAEQARRIQAVRALGLTHPLELHLWFGIPAVTSREAWIGLDALGVTAADFFAEVLAARAGTYLRPPHYLRTEFKPSEIISARKQLAARHQQEAEETPTPTDESVPTGPDSDRETDREPAEKAEKPTEREEKSVHESEATNPEDNLGTDSEPTEGAESSTKEAEQPLDGRGNERIAPERDESVRPERSGKEIAATVGEGSEARGTNVGETQPQSLSTRDDSCQKTRDSNALHSHTHIQKDSDGVPPSQSHHPTTTQAMRGTTNSGSGVGMGVMVSTRRRRTLALSSSDDSGIGMDESEMSETEENTDKTDKTSDSADKETPQPTGKPTTETETACGVDVSALEELFNKGLDQISKAKEYIARQEDDEEKAMADCATLKSKMMELNERMVARAADLLRAADGDGDEWDTCAQGELRAGEWEKELIQAGALKRKRMEDAAMSRGKRAKVEAHVGAVAVQVQQACQTLDTLQRICEEED